VDLQISFWRGSSAVLVVSSVRLCHWPGNLSVVALLYPKWTACVQLEKWNRNGFVPSICGHEVAFRVKFSSPRHVNVLVPRRQASFFRWKRAVLLSEVLAGRWGRAGTSRADEASAAGPSGAAPGPAPSAAPPEDAGLPARSRGGPGRERLAPRRAAPGCHFKRLNGWLSAAGREEIGLPAPHSSAGPGSSPGPGPPLPAAGPAPLRPRGLLPAGAGAGGRRGRHQQLLGGSSGSSCFWVSGMLVALALLSGSRVCKDVLETGYCPQNTSLRARKWIVWCIYCLLVFQAATYIYSAM